MTQYSITQSMRGPGLRRGESRRGGQWKLAYADFLTALAALFIVLWASATYSDPHKSPPPMESAKALDVSIAPDLTKTLERVDRSDALIEIRTQERDIIIDFVDRRDAPLFAANDATLTKTGIDALTSVGAILSTSGLCFELEGHTDAFPRRGDSSGNWALSVERAEAAWAVLKDAGVSSGALIALSGRGDTQPLYPEEPHLPANRRVSIVIQAPGEQLRLNRD